MESAEERLDQITMSSDIKLLLYLLRYANQSYYESFIPGPKLKFLRQLERILHRPEQGATGGADGSRPVRGSSGQ